MIACMLALALAVATPGTPAHPHQSSMTRHRSAASEAEVGARQWLKEFDRAFRARDLKAVMALYSDDVVAYDVVAPLQYVGKEAYRKDFEQFFAQYDGPLETEYRDVHILAAKDMAVIATLERISGTIKGQRASLWLRATTVLRKVHGSWLDVHDHVSVPADVETGKALLDLRP
ncbi:MAG TPA: SgcJ/EcaC family oxidoreductase [Chthonomonadaceae bacterium]|nr:SgcJ/EcaC family oxidoreductase [Chthonomonadaceae bacterium]